MNISSKRPESWRWLANVGTGYLDIAVGGAIYVSLTPILIRSLGTDAYAIWLLSHAITFYLRFFDFGFGQAQVRLHARLEARKQPRGIERLLATVLITLVCTGSVAAVLGLAMCFGPSEWLLDSSSALEADLRVVLAILATNLFISIPGSALENVYEGSQRLDVLNLRSVVLRVLSAAAQLVLVMSGHGIVEIALVELATTCTGLIIDLVLIGRLFPRLLTVEARFHPDVWKRIRRFSIWASIDEMIAEGTVNLDEILIAALLPLSLLTPYALYASLAAILILAVEPLTATIFPRAAALHASCRPEDLRNLLVSGTRTMVAISTPIAAFLFSFGDGLVRLWVPEIGDDAPVGLLSLMLGSSFVSVYLSSSTVLLMATNRIRMVVVLTLLEVLVEVGLILSLAPTHGLLGIALAGLIANASIGLLIELPLTCRAVGISAMQLISRTLVRLSLPTTAVAAAAVGLRATFPNPDPWMLAIAAIFIAVVWIGACWTAGISDAERRKICRTIRDLRTSMASF